MKNLTLVNKKLLLLAIWIIMLIHFLKDMTQDILGIPSVLDLFGNIQENTSTFPIWLEYLYHWAMVNTFIGELILIFLIPKYIFKTINRLEKLLIIGFIFYIPLIFLLAFLQTL